jgi:hypothetical protein
VAGNPGARTASQCPGPENLIFGLEEMNRSCEFLANDTSQEIKKRMKDSGHRGITARCGIFRDCKVFLPRMNLRRVRFWGVRLGIVGEWFLDAEITSSPRFLLAIGSGKALSILFGCQPVGAKSFPVLWLQRLRSLWRESGFSVENNESAAALSLEGVQFACRHMCFAVQH